MITSGGDVAVGAEADYDVRAEPVGDGRVLMHGTPAELSARADFTEPFFGSAPQAPK